VWWTFAAVFVVAWIVVAAGGGDFVSVANLQNIGQRSVALGLVTIGQTIVVLAGSLDLSVAYVVSVSAMVGSVVMAGQPGNIPLAVAAALGAGALAGLANGLVVTGSRSTRSSPRSGSPGSCAARSTPRSTTSPGRCRRCSSGSGTTPWPSYRSA
jgi:ribose/xylose/arabinose/galactoside ABC-type transport system permease subunit